ncbi:MAG: hypothetical protein EA343_24315 [Nodularia sp. (in: Bacteria)]|nr:MAG: hypothetical protein EA343_24315 [Nodularia sp. (in: cyanobacteria)]
MIIQIHQVSDKLSPVLPPSLHLVPHGVSQKFTLSVAEGSKVKSQKTYSRGFSLILNGLSIYAVLY